MLWKIVQKMIQTISEDLALDQEKKLRFKTKKSKKLLFKNPQKEDLEIEPNKCTSDEIILDEYQEIKGDKIQIKGESIQENKGNDDVIIKDDIIINEDLADSKLKFKKNLDFKKIRLLRELRPPINKYEIAYETGFNTLNDFQKEIIADCLKRPGGGGLSLPMGSGKTLVSIVLALKQNMDQQQPSLIICAKSLIASWITEFNKFFGDYINVEVLHSEVKGLKIDQWRLNDKTMFVLTTPEVLTKYYRSNNVDNILIDKKMPHPPTWINYYKEPNQPFLTHTFGGGYIFSRQWGSLIVDEAQKYTKIDTFRCQALVSICARARWALSGTLFDEPTAERIMGYYMMLNIPGMPRNLPDIKAIIKHPRFTGLKTTMVSRDKNLVFKMPDVNEVVVSHQLNINEAKIYTMMKKILVEVKKRVEKAKLYRDRENTKRFSSYLLVMITYLRQALICPLIPIASIAIDASDVEKKSELSAILMEEIGRLQINPWLNDPEAVKSSRIKECISKLNSHRNERVVLFSCYKSCLDILQHYMPKDRPVLRITANMNIEKRGQIVEELGRTDNGIMLLTYQLGAEGLNLQCASTVLLMDFWWNAAKTQQAIARVLRYGQKAEKINIYFFSSNTGIEEAMFKKQKSKLLILDELKDGAIKTKIPQLRMNDVIKLIESDKNEQLLNEIYHQKPVKEIIPQDIIIKEFKRQDGSKSIVTFSLCKNYRYKLSINWDKDRPKVLFIMLNPSIANGKEDDPTVRRVINYAKSWGYGGVNIGNLYAYISTDPKKLVSVNDKMGQHNLENIKSMAKYSSLVVYAWGQQIEEPSWLKEIISKPHYIELSIKGTPKHPLYLNSSLKPKLYRE